ncbi:hypothetical protein ABL78_4798 [Leptomonas seymouri]|uniref:Uncharacterized protein n=1 Tax=Leptomonas seymouri TaxID=5684 RepID=A0A0N1I5V6_LEPSE|nr:hypothetical protein ABL78_4798 [Leptomonas seymouri]|eukprot:KPI86143.1 hypothetical protein ABL78_4798 [Leptomonas seymouri]
MKNRATPTCASEGAAVTAATMLTAGNRSPSSKSSSKTSMTPLSGVVRHHGATPALSPTEGGPIHSPATATSSASKASTDFSTPPLSVFMPAPAAATASDTVAAKRSCNASASASPSMRVTPSSTPMTVPPKPPVGDRGWDPLIDGRFRIGLMHCVTEDIDEWQRYEDGNGGSSPHPSEPPTAAPDERSSDAAMASEAEAHRTPAHDAFCSAYRPGEPCVEVEVEASLVNAINSAYTSTGYPFVVTTGNTRGAVYGSFVDTRNPSLSSLELPPAQSYIVAPSYTGGQPSSHGLTEMDTLLAIQWGRGDRMMTAAGSAAAAAVASAQVKSAGSSAAKEGKGASPSSVARPGGAGPAGTPYPPSAARTITHHLAMYPEGIHGVHTSTSLRTILVKGELPTEPALSACAPAGVTACAPLAVAGGNVGVDTDSEEASAAATAPAPANAEANVPPLPHPPESNAPVQHTLVSASTFNHLSVYIVAHQDGKVLYTAALQSLSASIATRKVTAHQLILVGREEVKALAVDPLAAVTSKPERRTKIAFADLPVAGGEAAVFFQSKTSRFVGADASRRTVSAAPVRFTVEPHLIFGNQNGDIFIFSLLQERIVQHINYSMGSQQVSASITSGNSGVGSKLICSSVSSIVEVQNGVEQKIARMLAYAMVAKRNHRSYFDSDDVPASFTQAGASEPAHYYYSVPPSLYAIGFDNGQVLLICVTCEGGWMLRHFSSQYFGLRAIQAFAVRVPPFYTRLWTGYLPAVTKQDPAAATAPPAPLTALVTMEQTLIVHEEEQHIAAIACNGGSIVLVRLPGLEIIASVAPTDYNAVGEILALQWTSTSTRHLLTPDVLVASGEDDTMTAFQLLPPAMAGYPHHNDGGNGVDASSRLPPSDSVFAGGRLRILEKKKFHRSWVSRLNMFPIALPAASATALRSGGMPQYLGVCLLATSYDRRTSFWPYVFTSREDLGEDGNARPNMKGGLLLSLGDAPEFVGGGGGGGPLGLPLASMGAAPDHYVLVNGPTAAYALHTELVVSVAAAGSGTSFFLVTVCCRGKVKFWSLKVVA